MTDLREVSGRPQVEEFLAKEKKWVEETLRRAKENPTPSSDGGEKKKKSWEEENAWGEDNLGEAAEPAVEEEFSCSNPIKNPPSLRSRSGPICDRGRCHGR